MAGGRLAALDGVRGIAAIAVVWFHAHTGVLPFFYGYLAVDLFFMLSGFVIARSYENALTPGASGPRMGFGSYMRLRLERLYPMLLLGGLMGVTTFALGLSQFVGEGPRDVTLAVISQFLLIPFLCSAGFFAFNCVQWSMVLELLANAFHAATLRWLSLGVLAGVVAVGLLGLVFSARTCGTLNTFCSPPIAFYFLCLSRTVFGFFTGVMLHRTQRFWLPKVPQVSFPLLAVVLLLLMNMPVPLPLGEQRAIYDFVCIAVVFPPFVMASVAAKAGRDALALGTLSYPLYAIHLPLIDAFRNAGGSEPQACAFIVFLIALAWALGHWIDEPLNALRRCSRARRRDAQSDAARRPALDATQDAPKGGDIPPRFA